MMTAAERAKSGEIVNIGTGRETTNLEVVEILERISGKKLEERIRFVLLQKVANYELP